MGKITEKAREFCQSGIVGTMQHVHSHFNSYTCVYVVDNSIFMNKVLCLLLFIDLDYSCH